MGDTIELKIEHQRRNPHLYTTLYQCVNADGTITTFDDVTRELQKMMKIYDRKLNNYIYNSKY